MRWYEETVIKNLYGNISKKSIADCQYNNERHRGCRIGEVRLKGTENLIEVDFRKMTASVMLERVAMDYPDANAAFVIVWPRDGTMPEYFTNTTDEAVIMLRLQQFIHKWYNGDFVDVDNSD